jgi:hypothetical protein
MPVLAQMASSIPMFYVFRILFHTLLASLEDIHIIASCIPG